MMLLLRTPMSLFAAWLQSLPSKTFFMRRSAGKLAFFVLLKGPSQ
jgi:hypothetical protein